MRIPLQITVRDFPASPPNLQLVRDKLDILDRFQGHITNCRVTVSRPQRHRDRAEEYEVTIEVRARGHVDIIVNRQRDGLLHVAMRQAFEAVARMLDESLRSSPRGRRTARADDASA